jgi:hypothetical protein
MPDYYQDEPDAAAKAVVDNWMAKAGLRVGNWNDDRPRIVHFRGNLIEYTPAELDRLRKKLGGSEK